MKITQSLFIVLISSLFFVSLSFAKKHAIQHNVSPATRPGVSSMQKQLVKNAKVIIKTSKADLKVNEKQYRQTKTTYDQAKKEYSAAYEKMKNGKSQKIRTQGRYEVSTTSRKLTEAENAYFAADKQLRTSRAKHAEAKENLKGLRKHGWQSFFARQQKRDGEDISVVMPRAQRDGGGAVNEEKFKQDMAKATHAHAYSGM